ncbi:TIGR03086 family metal-binding protein [Pseudonocardia sp. H11422]|uniref:TIGR03086 family metal-binding protein n=1 Tax=Pseudonocardia sp. H11422 TaxID=2835866 RepID=UPI001BDC8BCE|nr:TIGR03086 family metal-binding protein [Pseudonocardia sp. H11422]
MTAGLAAPSTALLERAIGYALGSLHLVTPDALSRPTPCDAWDLRALLVHMDDSLAALHEATGYGGVALAPVPHREQAADLVALLRERACGLLGAWTAAPHRDVVAVGDLGLPTRLLLAAGAVEVTVHGWDVAQACGEPRAIPPVLATELLGLAPLLVTAGDRPVRFAAATAPPPSAGPESRLLAFLGRHGESCGASRGSAG